EAVFLLAVNQRSPEAGDAANLSLPTLYSAGKSFYALRLRGGRRPSKRLVPNIASWFLDRKLVFTR
ncbi:hypothetical protein, partial [Achromobacter dolens]|uniref:hypothetical protein n=1 Tax=Achromobacter dolens TaxID=1287738 RepID=UPI0031D9976F